MYSEDELLPLSGLQHLLFCERQCALIHIEQLWNENLYTAEGKILHEKVDKGGVERRGDVRVEYGLPIRSLRLGLVGKADVVEFHKQENGIWQPYPVEYKRGRPKKMPWDKVQLCAQAICLEEMLETQVTEGALFYGKTRRRQRIVFDEALRGETETAAARYHELIESGVTPKSIYRRTCDNCSLRYACLPKSTGKSRTVAGYIQSMLQK